MIDLFEHGDDTSSVTNLYDIHNVPAMSGIVSGIMDDIEFIYASDDCTYAVARLGKALTIYDIIVTHPLVLSGVISRSSAHARVLVYREVSARDKVVLDYATRAMRVFKTTYGVHCAEVRRPSYLPSALDTKHLINKKSSVLAMLYDDGIIRKRENVLVAVRDPLPNHLVRTQAGTFSIHDTYPSSCSIVFERVRTYNDADVGDGSRYIEVRTLEPLTCKEIAERVARAVTRAIGKVVGTDFPMYKLVSEPYRCPRGNWHFVVAPESGHASTAKLSGLVDPVGYAKSRPDPNVIIFANVDDQHEVVPANTVLLVDSWYLREDHKR